SLEHRLIFGRERRLLVAPRPVRIPLIADPGRPFPLAHEIGIFGFVERASTASHAQHDSKRDDTHRASIKHDRPPQTPMGGKLAVGHQTFACPRTHNGLFAFFEPGALPPLPEFVHSGGSRRRAQDYHAAASGTTLRHVPALRIRSIGVTKNFYPNR